MNIKKQILFGNLTILASAAPIAVVSCSLFPNKTKLEFYNFELYMNDLNRDTINKYYRYNEFGDLPEFEKYLDSGMAIGGISNDYFNAKLAGKGKIEKIDFSKLFEITDDRTKWSTELQNLYTPKVWNILNKIPIIKMDNNGRYLYRLNDAGTKWSNTWNVNKLYYDKNGHTTTDKEAAISHDVDGDGIDDYLWEFMIPYFFQNKVIAFNPFSFSGTSDSLTKIKNAKSQNELNQLFEESTTYKQNPQYSYTNILKWLRKLGGQRLTVNNYMRDNAIIGSEKLDINSATGMIDTEQEGKKYLDNFASILQTSWKDDGGTINTFSTDGTKILMDLNRVSSQQNGLTDVAIIYNGDALDAYMAGEWDDNELLNDSKAQIRIMTPKNSSSTVDGIVLSSLTSQSERIKDNFYLAMQESLYKNVRLNQVNVTNNDLLFQNYDLIQYTPTFNYLYKYLLDTNNYFAEDKMALDIMNSPYLTNELLVSPISDDLIFKLTNLNDKHTRELQN